MTDFFNPNENNDENDDNEDEEATSLVFAGRDGLIFLIDAHASISDDAESFQTCLQCIESCLLNVIIASERDLVGIVFYNTVHSPEPKNKMELEAGLAVPQHTAIFIPLMTTSKDIIQYLKNFKESSDFFDFKNRYGTSKSSNFSEALWLCSRMFMRCGYKLQSTTIVLFTNNEQPHPIGSHELQKSFVRAKDLRELGVYLILAPLVDDFDAEPFFKEFLCTVMDEDPDTWKLKPPAEQRELLMNRMYKHDYRRACHRYFNFNLADDLAVGVGIYSFKSTTFVPKSVRMLRDSNQIVVGRVCWKSGQCDDDREEMVFDKILLPGELRKYQEIGGQKIIFTPEELTRLKAIVTPGMRLLGFKPMATLPERCFIRSSRFLYPNEKAIKGSAQLFRALWEKCLEKQVYAMCVFCQIRKTAPLYVALVPQQRDPDGNDGFRVIYLPTQSEYSFYICFAKN